MINPKFVDHLVFRILELDRTEHFYNALFGEPVHRTEDSLMYLVGDTRVFFTVSPESQTGIYNKEKVGLNHVAFGVRSLTELEAIGAELDSSEISHSGLKVDQYGQREFIWLDDPDGLRIEFYLRSKQE
jgi:glyoxylase I family protein